MEQLEFPMSLNLSRIEIMKYSVPRRVMEPWFYDTKWRLFNYSDFLNSISLFLGCDVGNLQLENKKKS